MQIAINRYRFGVGTIAIREQAELHLYLEQIQEYILCISINGCWRKNKNKDPGIRIKKWVETKKKI